MECNHTWTRSWCRLCLPIEKKIDATIYQLCLSANDDHLLTSWLTHPENVEMIYNFTPFCLVSAQTRGSSERGWSGAGMERNAGSGVRESGDLHPGQDSTFRLSLFGGERPFPSASWLLTTCLHISGSSYRLRGRAQN